MLIREESWESDASGVEAGLSGKTKERVQHKKKEEEEEEEEQSLGVQESPSHSEVP